MADLDNSLSLASLLCQEDEASCFNYTNIDDTTTTTDFQQLNLDSSSSSSCVVLEDEDVEYIEKMVELEIRTYMCLNDDDDDEFCSVANYSGLKFARLDAIDWIFNTRAVFGFQFHTAYLSVMYFDRFLSKRSIEDGKLWAIRLLSVACLSLAAKMEECRVPALSEFPTEDYCFENKVIQRMELLVLNTLQWKMGSITPFFYLHYFINKICGESRPKGTLSRAVELILAAIKEINLLDHRPSIVAVAAVLAASDIQLTRQEVELKVKVISPWGSQENEIEMGKVKTPKQVISPNSSSFHSSSIAVVDNSSFNTIGAGTKRRLVYNDSDQNTPVKKICHRP